MLVVNVFTMKLKYYFLSALLLFFYVAKVVAQENNSDNTKTVSSSPATIEETTSPSIPTPPVNSPSTNSSTNDESTDKNFGPVFDGASISVSAGMNVYYGDIAAYHLFPKPSQFGDHMSPGFKFSIAREIKWGFSGQLSYQRGRLKGTRKTGKHSSEVTFRNNFSDVSLQVRYPISDALFKKNEYRRFKIYATLGMGAMWYRTQLYDPETLNTKDYEGYIEVDETASLAQKTLSDKTKKAKTWAIPYGVIVSYKYNYKIDFHLDITQTSTTTDRIDAFDRSWTAKDKYNYIGLGVTYNFNRTADDAPKTKPKKPNPNDAFEDDQSNSNNKDADIRKSILSKGKKKPKKGSEDELLNVRLKLFETQLKLFEMQYLIGN